MTGFRLVVNIPTHTYSVYVTPAGGPNKQSARISPSGRSKARSHM